jgi:hypothetical protein
VTAPLSRAEILALPPTHDLPTLGRALGRSEPTIRQANRSGELEQLGIKVVRLGAKYLVITESLWNFLGIAPDGDARRAVGESRPRVAARHGGRSASALRPVRGERC